jgi:hypothetical protein
MRALLFLACFLAGSLASSGVALAAPQEVQGPPREPHPSKFDFYLGVRGLDRDDWAPVEDQIAVGIEFVHEYPDDWFGYELAVFASGATKQNVQIGAGSFNVRGRTSEFSAGLRKTFSSGPGSVSPYVGAGLSLIRAALKGDNGGVFAEDDDTSAGVYVHGGIDFPIGPSLTLGVDLRALGGTDITIFGASAKADYAQLALVLGARL